MLDKVKLSSNTIQQWNNLVSTSVLGLDRSGEYADDNVRLEFMNKISVLSVINKSGKVAGKCSDASFNIYSESENVCSQNAADNLREILNNNFNEMLTEWCLIASSNDIVVPPECLPDIFESAMKLPEKQRYVIQRVIGKRGQWLSLQNNRWKDVFLIKELNDEQWLTGNREERLALLKHLRVIDPAKARGLLEQTWPEETPDDRVVFLECMKVGVTLDDEDFLEQSLDDKRKPVRTASADLLARISGSKLCQRMIARINEMIIYHPAQKGLLKKKKAEIEVTLPDIKDKEMLRDGADPVRAGKMGKKAVALANIIGMTPLSFWEQYESDIKSLIITCCISSEFSTSFALGFSMATVRQQNKDWAKALILNCHTRNDDIFSLSGKFAVDIPYLISFFEDYEKEEVAQRYLSQYSGSLNFGILDKFLYACDHVWSRDFSSDVIKANQKEFNKCHIGYDKRYMMYLATHLHPSIVPQLENGWPTKSSLFNDRVQTQIDNIISILKFRKQNIEELNSGI